MAFLWLAAVAAGLLSAGCGLDQKGMVLFVDPTYRARVLGTERDGFTVPDGILWSQGRLYVADEGGQALRIWAGRDRVTTLCGAEVGVRSPEDLVMDPQGNLYFTDDDAGGVWTISNHGEAKQLAGRDKGLISTEGIALARDGSLLVGDGDARKVFSVAPNGDVSVFLGEEYGISKAESMVFDDKGTLYIADNDAKVLYLLTPDKILHRVIEDMEGFSPETLWFANGVLYITDSAHGKLSKYTPEDGLSTIAVFGGALAKVNGVTSDETGNIYVSIQTDLKRKVGYILKIERDR